MKKLSYILGFLFLSAQIVAQTIIATDVTATRKLVVPATTAAVTASTGSLKIDTDADNSNITQSLLTYYDGTRIMYGIFVDALPSTDNYALTYDSVAKKFVFEAQAGGGGSVSISGTPSAGQIAEWTSATAIQGVTATGTGSPVKATAPTFPSTITIGAAGGTTGAALFKGTTSGTVTLSVAAAAGTYTLKLPNIVGAADSVLTTDGAGQADWDGTSGTGVVLRQFDPVISNVAISGGTFGDAVMTDPDATEVKFLGGGGNVTVLAPASGVTTHTIKLPAAQGAANQLIKNDGAGQLGYVSPYNTGVAEATVASATTTDIGAAASDKVSITGTTTITGFGTVAAGTVREGRFTGVLQLTHNGTSLILPGAANITTAVNDRFRAYSLGSGNWLVASYTKADGTAVVGGGGGVSDGDKGDITVTGSGATWTIDNDVVSNAKAANMAASTIKARVTGSTGDPEDATLSQVLDLVGSAANGDILVRSGGSWTRLAAGTTGATLFSDGASVSWMHPRTHFYFYEEFCWPSTIPSDWLATGSGSNVFDSGEAGEPGIFTIHTSTSATATRGIIRGAVSILLGGGRFYCEFRVRIPVLSVTASERFIARIGFTDQSGAPVDGAIFEYTDNVNSGNWVLRTSSNSSSTTVNSSSTVDTSWHNYGILVNAAGTSIDFFVDGTNIGTATGTIPTGAGRQTGVGVVIEKTVGTTRRDMNIGYAMGWNNLTTSR